MKLSDYVVDFISKQGVRHVFMLPGGGAMHLNDSLGRHSSLKFVCNLHEQASAIAAEAYGQYSGLGVAMVTTGPGGTNALTGVAGAWLESTPVLFISGQVKRLDLVGSRGVRQIGFQEIDIVSIVRPITKYAVTVEDPESIRMVLEKAVWNATHGRKGPVWVDIPLDIQAANIVSESLCGFVPPPVIADESGTVRLAVDRTVALLADAKRPVVLVGNGVRHADAVSKFVKWAETIGIPVLTTWKALDFLPETHPLFAGRPGAVGQRAANFAQQKSDLIICLGARLDFGQTAYRHENFAPLAKRVVVDIDPNEISKLKMEVAVALEADVGRFIDELCLASSLCHFPDWAEWLKLIHGWRVRFPIVLPAFRTIPKVGVNNYVLIEAIGSAIGKDWLLVPGSSGACSEVTCQSLQVKEGLRFINTQGLGAMGFGIPAAIGACIASGGKRTVCVDGDGGFPMNAQELSLISAMSLPIVFIVLNNAGYGSIRTTQINYFERKFMACDANSGLFLPSIEKLAETSGIPYRQIRSQKNLRNQIVEILEITGPVICEVLIVADQYTQPKVSSTQEPGGKMITCPMEDLWPFLDRQEFRGIMAE